MDLACGAALGVSSSTTIRIGGGAFGGGRLDPGILVPLAVVVPGGVGGGAVFAFGGGHVAGGGGLNSGIGCTGGAFAVLGVGTGRVDGEASAAVAAGGAAFDVVASASARCCLIRSLTALAASAIRSRSRRCASRAASSS